MSGLGGRISGLATLIAAIAASAASLAIGTAGDWQLGAVALGGSIAFVATYIGAGWILHRQLEDIRVLAAEARDALGHDREPSPAGGDLEALAATIHRAASRARRTRGRLDDERARFDLILENMNEGLICADADGRVQLINQAAVDLLERDRPETGRSVLDYVRAPAIQELLADPAQLRTIEVELASGRVAMVSRSALENAGSLLVLRDVTEIRRLETMRRDFVANVSHELRTPLAVIRANAETLIDLGDEDPEVAETLLSAIDRQAERMNRIVGELLDLSRIESGVHRVSLAPVAVSVVAERALAVVARAAAVRRSSLTSHVGDARVLADEDALERVLVNLIDNAIKHTPAESSISVRTVETTGWIEIEIEDDGTGIEARYRPRLFERFFRADPGRARSSGGTGLGLAIVKHLVELMGGEVGIRGDRLRGACFWVRLPAAEISRTADDPL